MISTAPSLTLPFPPLSIHVPSLACRATATTCQSQSETILKKTMERLKGNAQLMIVSDLDKTMVDHDDPVNLSLLRFNALWESNYRSNSLLVFSTGRSPASYKLLRKDKPLLTPDITILSVGTEITYGNSMLSDDPWLEFLNQKWDRNIVSEETNKYPELTLQSDTEQRPHKVSFHVQKDKAKDIMKSLSIRLKERGLDVKMIFSSGKDLDVLPRGAGKGQALAYLHKKFKAEGKLPKHTLVCGDSGNDAELFSIPDVYGVMVSNAQEEMLQWHAANAKDNPDIIHATERCAAGIIQALGHFKLGLSASPRDVMVFSDSMMASTLAYEVVKFYLFYERWRRAEIENSEQGMTELKSVCCQFGIFVHPSGCEQLLLDCVNSLRLHYGDQQGKQFSVWVDQVLPTQVSSDVWLVKFKKWEQTGEERQCCLSTALLCSKGGASDAEGLIWAHLHQTWLHGSALRSNTAWLF